MNFQQLLNENKLKKHKTSRREIQGLLGVVDRDIADAGSTKISPDWKFAIAYNALLQSSTISLYCKGYKPMGLGHHFIVFQTLRLTMGKEFSEIADYFDSCRNKRNVTEYDRSGEISETEAKELLGEAKKFKESVVAWLKKHYSHFL